jgi:hypothetical protein
MAWRQAAMLAQVAFACQNFNRLTYDTEWKVEEGKTKKLHNSLVFTFWIKNFLYGRA